ncbi:MAG TPA: TonB-dependent receptor [Bryobacteraceae bacterium]|nr:TonB-dependent receptor [Bryobacteraceae bacterium]
MKRLTILLLLAALPPFIGALSAQSDRGAITGTVTDATGAVVPGVQIAATNLSTGVVFTATTNEVGLYSVLNIPIGRYSVAFTKQGFKTYTRDGISIAVAQVVQLNANMEVGALAEAVTVTAEAQLLETQSTQVGAGMNSNLVTDLPLDIRGGRSLENFAYATIPGVEGNNWTSYIGGSMAFTKEVLIDGTSAVVQIGGHIGESSPSMEAIQEFKVETSGIRAEDGRTGGGVFKFTLKSGTNDFHGSAFGFLHNEVLNANTWQSNFQGDKRATDRQFVYGFSAGGPIIRNKTFAFGAFEKYTQERFVLGAYNATVPLPAFLDGNFSELLNTGSVLGQDALGRPVYQGMIYDPATQRNVTAGSVDPVTGLTAARTGMVREGFGFDPVTGAPIPSAANVIPSNRISTISKNITDVFRQRYLPMRPGLINNTAITRQNDPWFHQTQLTFKADHNFSDANRLSGHFVWTERPRILVDQGGIWDPADPDKAGGPMANSRKQEVTSRRFALNHTYNFSPTVLNIASFTFGRYRNPSFSVAAKDDWPSKLGFGETGAGNFPVIEFGRAINGIDTTRIGQHWSDYYVGNTFIGNESLTWIRGRHTMRFGGEFRAFQLSSHQSTPTLEFQFDPDQTGAPKEAWRDKVGFGFASFLLGGPKEASQQTPWDLYGRRKAFSIFAQDDFKISRNLTLTMDLRWEVTFPYHEKYGRWANFDKKAISESFGIPGTLVFAKNGDDTFETERDWKEFSPHVGIAYQIGSRAVLRAGYGLFYSPIGMNYWFGVPYGFAPGYRGTNRVTPTADLSPAFNWDVGYPGTFVPGTKDPDYTQWGMVNVNPKSLFAGYSHQWNIGTQFTLTNDLRLDVTYMQNEGRRLQSGDFERNQPDPGAMANLIRSGHVWDAVSDAGSAASAGVPFPFEGFGSYAFAAIMPYPQIWQNWVWGGPLLHVGSPYGRSDYKALQLAVTKRTERGLTANVSYTLATSHSNLQNSLGGFQEIWSSGPLQDVLHLDEEAKAPLFYDQRHVFKGIVAWDLPFGTGRRYLNGAGRVANAILGGWTLSGSFRYNSGSPIGVNSSNYYPGWEAPVYALRNENGDYSRNFEGSDFNFGDPGLPGNLYFDPKNFSNPPDGDLGTVPMFRSDFRGFGWSEEQVAILKNFRIAERFRLQFRAEFYNVFNRHHFDTPDTNISSGTFGHVINLTGTPREGQFGARFEW